jgi:hypothetical protein
MPKWIIASPLILLLACNAKKVSILTPKQQMAKVDSIVRAQQKWIREQEQESLRDRLSIEVKERTDSILAIYKAQNKHVVDTSTVADTAITHQDTTQH